MEPKHTPTPWKVKGNLNTIENANGLTVCDLRSNTVDADTDAAYIVRAVNCHQEMRDLLGRCHSWISDHSAQSVDEPLAREVYEAIAKAGGK